MLIEKSVVSPPHVRTNVITFLYISLMRVMYLVGTLCFSKAHHMIFLSTLSYAFSRSMKTMCKSFFCSLYLSIVGFKSIRVAIFYAGLPKPNANLLLYPGLGPAMLRRLRRERVFQSA